MIWFLIEMLIGVVALSLGLLVGGRKKRIWIPLASISLVLILLCQWLRTQPEVVFKLFPLDYSIYFENTSFVFFALFFFGLASRNVSTRFSRWGILILCGLLFVYLFTYLEWIFTPVKVWANISLFDDKGVCMQTTPKTCGAASLVTLLDRWGIKTDEREMARLSLTSEREGTNPLRMARALIEKTKDEGLKVDLVKLDWEGLKKVRKPCIVDTRLTYLVNHVVVLFNAIEKEVEIGDPLEGRVVWSKKEFLERWTGYTILLFKDSPFEEGILIEVTGGE